MKECLWCDSTDLESSQGGICRKCLPKTKRMKYLPCIHCHRYNTGKIVKVTRYKDDRLKGGVGWEHGIREDEGKVRVQCNYCGRDGQYGIHNPYSISDAIRSWNDEIKGKLKPGKKKRKCTDCGKFYFDPLPEWCDIHRCRKCVNDGEEAYKNRKIWTNPLHNYWNCRFM